MADGHCSFCKKPGERVAILVASDEAKICEQCVALAVQRIADELRGARLVPIATSKSPDDGAAQ